MVTCDICCTCLMPSLMACGTRWNIKSNENFSKSLLVLIDTLSGRTQDNAIRPSSFLTPFSDVWPTQIFGAFQKKKRNYLVKLFFSGSNSFNLENEYSNSTEKNRNKNRNIEQYIVYFVNPNMWMLTFNVVLGYQGILFQDFLWIYFLF